MYTLMSKLQDYRYNFVHHSNLQEQLPAPTKKSRFSVERDRPNPRPREPYPGSLRLRLRGRERRRYRDPAAVSPAVLALANAPAVCHRVRVAPVRISGARRAERGFGKGAIPGEQRAEEEVLHNGKLAEDFGEEHLVQTRVDFIPGLDLIRYGRLRVWRKRGNERKRRTADISSSMGECQRREAVLTELINWIQARYM